MCSNTVQQYELALVVDVDGIGEEVLALLITARYCARCFSLPSLPESPVTDRPSGRQQRACHQATLHFVLLSWEGRLSLIFK